MAFLKVILGSSSGQILALSGGKVVLGRHPSSQIVLDNAAVSRHHAQIIESNGHFLVEDLHSRNGTQVNGQPIRGLTELRDGDEIQVCDYAFVFMLKATGPSIAVVNESSGVVSTVEADNLGNRLGEIDAFDIHKIPVSQPRQKTSAVIASMSAGSSEQALRLNVRPEVKLRAILEISLSLSRVLNLTDMLPVILQSLFKIFIQADSSFILLKDPQTSTLRIRASHSRVAEDDNVPVSMTVVRQAMETGQAILSADVGEDRRFERSESLAEMQLRSLICTPLLDTNGQAMGVLQLSTRDLSQPFNSDDLDLLISVGAQASLAVENATLHDSLLRQRDFDRDMEVAAQVQLSFLPGSPPTIPGYEFADYYEAAQRIGGDYFDYVITPEGKVVIVIGDVSGKGIPAALLMARLHSSCRHFIFNASTAEQAMNGLNSEMSNSDLGYRFITLSIAILDPVRHEMQLASAGHLPPIVRHLGSRSEFVGIEEAGMPLGIADDQNYGSLHIKLEPNDTVVFYTDGITEALNSENELFSKHRLRAAIESGPEPVVELVDSLVGAVQSFRDHVPQRDDICVTAFRRIS